MKPQIVGWMGKRDASRGADTNYRRLEQDYEFSGGYGLKEPAGWEPLYALDAKDLLILELALKQQTERAEAAEAELLAVREDNHSMMLEIDGLRKELAKLREQEPVAYVKYKATGGNVGLSWLAIPTQAYYPREGEPLYVNPIPVPAPAVPDIHGIVLQLTLAETEMLNAKAWSPGTQAKRHIDFAMTAICCARALLQSAPTGEPK